MKRPSCLSNIESGMLALKPKKSMLARSMPPGLSCKGSAAEGAVVSSL
eukprot:CAMPEP_0181193074 /NCGR_PEP_ID=MMETSP1096-20121128/13624_1 /TAXON_ID=156174 ORGANISM="Chrysochromulina ericina, Strain CCMP281" /NCGR_SAMPLE_ID=MMETSP1096 /ASSEMBLY_ACC=CAM_ASM_000453 /LENGTH=47 /DNA_ID= /DNA_START= /DNA_END= /DNA_ORIENTATION=